MRGLPQTDEHFFVRNLRSNLPPGVTLTTSVRERRFYPEPWGPDVVIYTLRADIPDGGHMQQSRAITRVLLGSVDRYGRDSLEWETWRWLAARVEEWLEAKGHPVLP